MRECWSAGMLECWNAGMLECWNAGMLECWSAGMLEWGFRFSVLGGEALGAWRWALGGIGWRFADLVRGSRWDRRWALGELGSAGIGGFGFVGQPLTANRSSRTADRQPLTANRKPPTALAQRATGFRRLFGNRRRGRRLATSGFLGFGDRFLAIWGSTGAAWRVRCPLGRL